MAVNTNLGITVSQLPTVANMAATDSFVILSNTTGNLSVRTIMLGNTGVAPALIQMTPTHSNTPGTQGTIAYDSSYFYVCTATGWLRTALASF